MKVLALLLFACNSWAIEDEALRQSWLGRVKVDEVHQGYRANEAVLAPAGTWQTLFAVVLSKEKHCVHAKVPVKSKRGELRIVVVPLNQTCLGSWESAAMWERRDLRSLQFFAAQAELRLAWTGEDGRVQSLSSRLPDIRGVFFYPPNSTSHDIGIKLVGEINDVFPANPCTFTEGTCQLCRYGVYRVKGAEPEFYCGIDRCGEANQPACQRGIRWQKSRGPFSCRGQNDHVFCDQGLRVECQGEVALCR